MTLTQSAGNMHGWEVADQARRRAEMARYFYLYVPSSLTFMLLAWETEHIHVVGLWMLSGLFLLFSIFY